MKSLFTKKRKKSSKLKLERKSTKKNIKCEKKDNKETKRKEST